MVYRINLFGFPLRPCVKYKFKYAAITRRINNIVFIITLLVSYLSYQYYTSALIPNHSYPYMPRL